MNGKKAIAGAALLLMLASGSTYAIPTNLDFSAGLSGWTAGGQVIDGGGFAVFVEDPQLDSSRLYQDFVVAPGSLTLRFEYTIFSIGTFNHLALPDAFTARLLDPVSLAPLLATPTRTDYLYHDARGAANSLAYDGGLVTLAPVTDPLRPDWFLVTLDVSSLASGTAARLQFDLFGGNNGQDTLAAVDNVAITISTEPPIIPEPLSMTLVATALVGLATRTTRRRA